MLAFNLRDIVASREDSASEIHCLQVPFRDFRESSNVGKSVPQSNQEVPTCLVGVHTHTHTHTHTYTHPHTHSSLLLKDITSHPDLAIRLGTKARISASGNALSLLFICYFISLTRDRSKRHLLGERKENEKVFLLLGIKYLESTVALN
jgi:hypothetical protein